MAQDRLFGAPVPGFVPPPRPTGQTLTGTHVQLEPLRADLHAADLYRAMRKDDRVWDYLPYGPFAAESDYHQWIAEREAGPDPVFHALRDLQTGRCGGVASYLRITPEVGVIEVGHICLAPEMQATVAATEAMALMMAWAFDTCPRVGRQSGWGSGMRALSGRLASSRAATATRRGFR